MKTFLKVIFAIFIVFPIVLFVGGALTGIVSYFTASTPSQQNAPSTPFDISAQKQFEKKLLKYALSYKNQPNDIKKSKVYNDAMNWDKEYLTNHDFIGWTGTLESINTQKGGESATVVIKSCIPLAKEYTEGKATQVGDNVELRAPMFSDEDFCISYGTELDNKDPAYTQVGELPLESKIVFNGRFETGEENSYTEAGAMTAPEFKMTISSVKSR